MRLLQFGILASLLAILLSGCGAAGLADDAARYGDDLSRLAVRYGDDIARQADDLGRSAQKSDEAIQYWDEIMRASNVVDDGARLLYTESSLTPVQAEFVTYLRTEGQLVDDESLLFLQGVCFTVGLMKEDGKLPTKPVSQKYIEAVADHNDIPLSGFLDFAGSILDFSRALIDESPETDQKAADVLFDGLCLVKYEKK